MSRFSGKFVLRIRPETHARLREVAAKENASLNEVCSRLIQRGLDRADPYQPVLSCARGFLGRNLAGVVLIGSQARGTATARSDVDFLIVVSAGEKIHSALYKRWDLFKGDLPEKFSVHFVHIPELHHPSGLWLEAALEGHILMDEAGVSAVLQQLRNAIAAGIFRRRLSHGQPYWTQSDLEVGEKRSAK